MTMVSPDSELVSVYAAQGCEDAFRALVARHVSLVYATALRQVGDPGLAEEITQNVFVVLARKAPRLSGLQTLGGWLHRTTLLEAKASIRAELRRRRREQTAAEAVHLEREGTSPYAAMEPLLDEGLWHLREADRLALLLRFWESRSLKEVGAALGVEEEAARKRVSRALDRLADFFRQRGFAVSAAVCGGALASGTQAAPAGLVVTAANAGLAAGGPATGLNLLWLQLMSLTKTQTAVVCLVLAALPLGWQSWTQAQLARQQQTLAAALATARQSAGQMDLRLERANQSLERAREESRRAEARLGAVNALRETQGPRPRYQWDDQSPLVRVPKELLAQMNTRAVDGYYGQLTPTIKTVLQLTPRETEQTQAAIERFLADYHAAQARNVRAVPPTDKDLQGHKPEDTRVFEVPALGEEFKALRQGFFEELDSVLGEGRLALFRGALKGWMPADEDVGEISNLAAVVNYDRRERFYRPNPGDTALRWGFAARGSTIGASLKLDEISEPFRAPLQDWLDLARSQPDPDAPAIKSSNK
jgi:RNA polymerase sigma factor (sigma-70 family)